MKRFGHIWLQINNYENDKNLSILLYHWLPTGALYKYAAIFF